LAAEVAQLKKRHIEHVRRHVSGFTKHAVLKQKLLQGEPLQATEATGDCFNQLLTEVKVDELCVMSSPYQLSLQQFGKQVASLGEQLAAIVAKIESTWKV
jgi:hypothetical protein